MAYAHYPKATFKPLGKQTEPIIVPKVLIFHTMVGFLAGTYSMFLQDGYTGTESHFGVGGSWDSGLDGAVWQFQDIDRQADAQFDGNVYGVSVETSDGGVPSRPWTAKQITSLVDLGVWFCQTTGSPPVLVSAPGKRGIGYHAQFVSWSKDGHTCPGPVRLHQLTDTVIPAIGAKTYIRDGSTGPLVATLQRALGLTVTSVFGAATVSSVKNYQKSKHLEVDGIVGPMTWRSLDV